MAKYIIKRLIFIIPIMIGVSIIVFFLLIICFAYQIIDEITVDGKQVGLPDLKSGLEIKTLENATSYNTINGYLKSASKKKAQAVIFDNYKNSMEDEILIEMINRSQSFSNGSVYVYTQEGNVLKIR